MKLRIDIPEEYRNMTSYNNKDIATILRAVMIGTPLPMELILNDEGLFEEYDDTYDVVIHCDSEEARNEVLVDLKAVKDRFDILDKIRAEIEDLTYYCWEVSPRTVIDDVLEIFDKYKTESEDVE